MTNLICVPVTETESDAFIAAVDEAAQLADAVELRLDYLLPDQLPRLLSDLIVRVDRIGRPLILTFRPSEQGGRRELSLEDRQAFWRSLSPELGRRAAFVDFELDLVESFDSRPPLPWGKVICSWHDFRETPEDLNGLYERMARTPAAVVKIATQANEIGDCLRMFEVIDRARGRKPVIALAMGLPGLATRVLSLSRGAMLTFGCLRRGAESAAGQPTVTELRELYRIKRLTRESEIYGVIGKPIGHSRSPLIHNTALAALDRNGVYLPFEVDNVAGFVRDFVRPGTKRIDWNLRGLSVTIPYKLTIMAQLDYLDPIAQSIGAVNTVVVDGDHLRGYNTDVTGAMKPLDRLIDVRGARVAVIGAGGSARAVCYGLARRGADVTIYARDPAKARPLADQFKAGTALLDEFDGQAEIVINCTPIGMHGHSEGRSPVGSGCLRGVSLVYDLIYTPEETALLKDAKNSGCRTLGGSTMLVAQAAEQFRLWTGIEPPADVIRRAVNNRRE